MQTLLAFLVAIGVLVAVHEWGHFVAARACGVRVLRFSVGMGPTALGWTSKKTGTEFVIACLPIGGFVKMLGDDSDGAQPFDPSGTSFSEQPWFKKAAIAVAGPLANLMLAVVLFAGLGWYGVDQALPTMSAPAPGSRLAQAGFFGEERIVGVGFAGDALEAVATFDDLRWWLAQAAVDGRTVRVEYVRPKEDGVRSTQLSLQGLAPLMDSDGAEFYRVLGLQTPFAAPVLGSLQSDGAALAAGLQSGDRVLQVDQAPVVDAAQLRDMIRRAGASGVARPQQWQVVRGQAVLTLEVTPKVVPESNTSIGRVGAVIGQKPEMVTVRYSMLGGLQYGLRRTWSLCTMTWRALGRMVVGDGSLQQLSGPLTIADYAGKSAALGWESFINFLALMSVSLGVLNLLPLPVLDGGHLMYYLWESLCGRPVPAIWAERLQKAGLMLLVLMMSLAIFNDVARLLR